MQRPPEYPYGPVPGENGQPGFNQQPGYSPQNAGMPPADNEPQWTQVPLPGQGAQMGASTPVQLPPPHVPPAQPASSPPAYQAPGGPYAAGPGSYPQTGSSQGTGYPQEAGYPGQNAYTPVSQPQLPPHHQPPVQPNAGVGYVPPKTGMPVKRGKKRRGPGPLSIVLVLAAVGLAVFAVLRVAAPGQVAYGTVSAGSLNARYTGDAVVVRDEVVYTQDGVSQIDYEVDEGVQVQRGELVATVYSSGFSAKEWTTLSNYRAQIKEYHKVLIASATGDSRLVNLMSKVRERAMEAQQLVQGGVGSLTNQELLLTQAMEDCRTYMRQKYPDDQKLNRLYDDENTQLQRISTWTKQYASAADGLISFYTDGFETALNMSNYGDYSPAQVRQMYRGNIPDTGVSVGRNTVPVYRVVRQQPWAVLMLCNEMEWTPVTGRTYELRIESFDNTTVQATVESFTRSGGELLVRLRIDNTAALPSVLYNRSCQVQLGENVNTLMVPSRAILVQNGRKGVVISIGGSEYFAAVEVISDDGQQACVIPENLGVIYEGVRVRLF